MRAEGTKETVLVTGSSGLIGRAVAERFSGHVDVVGFDREGPPPHPPVTVECVCVDVTSEESVRMGLERVRYAYGTRIASVIHLAAYYDFSGEPSPKYEEVTVRGTQRLLRGLKRFDVGQFVFSSTMLVQAPCEPGQKINEDWPLDPKWDYPKSKVQTEELIRAERGDIPVVILRIAGVYDDRCHSIPLAHQIQRIFERTLTSHVFPGDISHGQAFLHLEDLIEAFLILPGRRELLPPELTVLLGEPETMSYEELQRDFGRLIHGEEWETREIPKALAKAGAWLEDAIPGEEPFIKPWMIDLADDHYALDITRAHTTLGWKPKRSLRDALPKMVAALKEDPPRFYRENKLGPSPSAEKAKPRTSENESGSSAGKPMENKKMSEAGHERMGHGMKMLEYHKMTLWTHFTVASLGMWLLVSPATLGYAGAGMAWSDWGSGALLVFFGLLSGSGKRGWPRWATCFLGIWLLFAPLVFWAPTAGAYANDTLVGSLVIAFSILIPGMPGMKMLAGPEIPPGWSYNPSSWHQRAPIIALAFVGFFISRYLAAFQLKHIGSVWDPFFGDGTKRVLTSDVSRAWPISDAGLGALSYMLEALSGYMGGKDRWRTMPWMVAMFGFLVVPLGITSIVLVILQPVAVGAWCALCLFTAVAMLIMVPLAVDEVVAMGQFLAQSRREGKPFWRTFWMGGTIEGGSADSRSPGLGSPLIKAAPAMSWGATAPWNLLASAALGVWLMFAPATFGISGKGADSDHLVGALIATFAVLAMAEVMRAVRLVNVLAGVWILAAPWLLSGGGAASRWNGILAGAAIVVLSLPRGRIEERYGSWNRYVV